TERKLAGTKSPEIRGAPRRGKQINFEQPVYKIVRSVRIIRPEEGAAEKPTFRQWTAPSYSFIVQGHWRNFQDPSRKGRDADGGETLGRTWVRSYLKYDDQGGQLEGMVPKKDP